MSQEEESAEMVKKRMTEDEWHRVYEMSQDKNLFHNLCSSLFPTIHGGCRLPAFPYVFIVCHHFLVIIHGYGASQGLFFWLLYMVMELASVCFLVIVHGYGSSQGHFLGYYT